MIKFVKALSIVIAVLLLQTTVFPYYLLAPFHPNLLVIMVVYLGLRSKSPFGALAAFSLGLLHDCFSGIYFGLNGFSYLCIFHALHKTADRLYTDSRYLMVLTVFFATIVTGLFNMLLLFIFSAANGIYATLLSSLIPQALVNALIASLIFMMPASVVAEEP
ncbi:cell shape-determining protein MreD, putative [Geotalea daltonii FRC-32]|uniref:Cell shape-determining protein MreD, putative n=1 Tax=Geotalea daltonii (strain DSM 22248 / JCM 15807 / FRC-32) TaxID=316067 RepID=B9M5R2_GEODF|nr:rod shape-determining protein MreD [Geotalea daltonii]ACM21821.1 cell shape-determining protein MreD, putative [Geotalea daltonii FRC-32]